jgi:pimeloyl-ACP methyl ester carboxylesterase
MNSRAIVTVAGSLAIAATVSVIQNSAWGQTVGVRVVQAGHATVHVTIRGHGDPIVFIASRGRGCEDFNDLSDRLVRAGYESILPQPRGIGGSSGPLEGITYHDLAADIAATIREVVGGPATIVGHAFGGRVARTLAADHPTLVKRLILLAAAGPIPRSPEIGEATDRVFDAALRQEDRLVAVQQSFFAKGNNARVWQDGWYFSVAMAQRAADARTPLNEWWAGGSAPILILQGAEDAIVLPENARKLAAEFPDRVTLVEVAHAGHAMLPEQPRLIADSILAYLAR